MDKLMTRQGCNVVHVIC